MTLTCGAHIIKKYQSSIHYALPKGVFFREQKGGCEMQLRKSATLKLLTFIGQCELSACLCLERISVVNQVHQYKLPFCCHKRMLK